MHIFVQYVAYANIPASARPPGQAIGQPSGLLAEPREKGIPREATLEPSSRGEAAPRRALERVVLVWLAQQLGGAVVPTRLETGRKDIQLKCEKEIVSTDGVTGGEGEFVVVNLVSVDQEIFIFIVESRRNSVGKAMQQCLLEMKDMRDKNRDGKVYGFVTTGETWQMLEYDGASFRKNEYITVVFDSMGEDKQRWMDNCSAVVDCIYFALGNRGLLLRMWLLKTT
ncbi:hypothetical protein EV426DRAFT_660083 [Tirmania nivea]|nr:hypothetical protein EV426DRAFT_660083 [Tirmania nivea]